MTKLSLVIITEKGRLESEAKVLIESIRTFGGRFANVPIYSYQPRKGHKVSDSTLAFFRHHEVHYVDEEVNREHADYAMANKIYAAAHAEAIIDSEVIIFMDSDSIVWKEPSLFYETDSFDLGVVPVFKKFGWAVTETDENYKYWEGMYELFPIEEKKYIRTVVDNERALAYYNGGLRVAKKEKNFYQQTSENFDRLMSLNQPFFKQHFLEQAIYSVTAHSMNLKIRELGKGYNYPLYCHGDIQNPAYKLSSLDEIITGHYTILFKKPGRKNPLKGRLSEGEKGQWFKAKAKEHGLLKPWYKRLL